MMFGADLGPVARAGRAGASSCDGEGARRCNTRSRVEDAVSVVHAAMMHRRGADRYGARCSGCGHRRSHAPINTPSTAIPARSKLR
eukprot:1712550-Rhodomonas_salina.2